MLPIPLPKLSTRQKGAALFVAGLVDFIQMPGVSLFGEGFLSPLEDVLDFITAAILIAICGFRWQFILAFTLELVPGITLFPTWTMVVLTLPTQLGPAAESPQRVNVNRVDDPPAAHSASHPTAPEIDIDAVAVPPVQSPTIQNP